MACKDRCWNGNVFTVKPDSKSAVALVYWTVMKPVNGVNECTRKEANLRASPGLRDEVWCGGAIRIHRLLSFLLEMAGRRGCDARTDTGKVKLILMWRFWRAERQCSVAWFCRSLTPDPTDLLMQFERRLTSRHRWLFSCYINLWQSQTVPLIL